MKALAYEQAHDFRNFALTLRELPEPELRPGDLLVEVKAISTNPVDFKVRSSRSGSAEKPVVLGWDAAGVIRRRGPSVSDFEVGDEVFYAGDLLRPGTYAEFHAVDARVVAKKPRGASFAEAAALPLTSLTAWEALFERGIEYDASTVVLIIGGAGGVGSVATQLIKQLKPARLLATASRPETRAWCEKMGADVVLDHRRDLREQLDQLGIANVDVVFGTTHTDQYLAALPGILRPFGHLLVIDDPQSLDIVPFKRKAISTHWELMFSKLLHEHRVESQGAILRRVAELVEQGQLVSTLNLQLEGLTPENLAQAHALGEGGQAIGKVVVTL